jgi:ABC-type sugar transport system substrate-binding protein
MKVPWLRGHAGMPGARKSAVVGVAIAASLALAVPVASAAGPQTPSKAQCNGKTYKLGYDVFSGTQPFANLVTQGLMDAAKSVGCVTIVKTVDNLNGPVAVGNLKTLLNQKIDGFIDFQVLAPFQTPIQKLLKGAKIPGVAIVGAARPGAPDATPTPSRTRSSPRSPRPARSSSSATRAPCRACSRSSDPS